MFLNKLRGLAFQNGLISAFTRTMSYINYCLSMQMAFHRNKESVQAEIAALQLANAEKECDSHLAQIPTVLHDNVMELTSVTLDRSAEFTVMLGIISAAYSSVMWRDDVGKWKNEFPNSAVFELQLTTLRKSPQLLDAADALPKIDKAFAYMNAV